MLPRDGAVIGIDLAGDKQALAVIDHDVRVLARKTERVKVFRLGAALDWAVGQARAKGFGQVTVACEPTGAVAAGAAVVRGAGAAAGMHPAADLPYRP
jgi:transposase